MHPDSLLLAVERLKTARRVIAFTGAGISVESGIPPFRGPGGLWSRYDPACLDIQLFCARPAETWVVIKEIFYDYFGQARPNAAHRALAKMETLGKLAGVITQNIDHLHQAAGSRNVIEYHGTSYHLVCTGCGQRYDYKPALFERMPPRCRGCRSVLKPDFVFFGEPIPIEAQQRSLLETRRADTWLVIGSTGEVFPACLLPADAKKNGATIIEINVEPSEFTSGGVTDIFLQGKATEVMAALLARMEDRG